MNRANWTRAQFSLAISKIPSGTYHGEDWMDDDGIGDDKPTFDKLCDGAAKKDAQLMSAARQAVKPITHVIRIEPVR